MERASTAGGNEIERALLEACQGVYPARSELRVADLVRVGDGWECEVFAFALVGVEGDQPRREDLILRVYPDAGGDEKASREYDAVRRLHRAGYAVPAMLALGREDPPAGRPFVVMERIDGPVMGSQLYTTSPERRDELIARFCRLFADLHAFDWRSHVSDPTRHSADGHLGRWIVWAERMLQSFGLTEFDPVLAWLRSRAADVRGERLSVTHGDYHPWNVLLRASDDAAFVIDWTQVDVADYRFDLGWTLVLMRTIRGRELRDATLVGYERAIGERVPDLDFFEVAAALRRAVSIVVSLTAGPEKLGMRPEAAVAMRKQVGHLATALAVIREITGESLAGVEGLVELAGSQT